MVENSLLRKLIWLKGLGVIGGGGTGYEKTVGPASVVSVSDAKAEAAKNIVIDIIPAQSGSGVPSPDNVRTISGWTGLNVYHSGADTSSPSVITVSWLTEVGTVYGGTLNVTTGELTVEYALMHFDATLNWSKSGSKTSKGFWRYFANANPSMKAGSGQTGWCDKLPTVKVSSDVAGVVLGYNNNSTVNILSLEESVADFKTWLTSIGGLDIVYPILETESYTISPHQLTMLLGKNNLWSDAGETTLTYIGTRRN